MYVYFLYVLDHRKVYEVDDLKHLIFMIFSMQWKKTFLDVATVLVSILVFTVAQIFNKVE